MTSGTPPLEPGVRWNRPGVDPMEVLRERGLWSSFQVMNHRILIRTVAGGAGYVARAVDAAHLPGALGTIAGNDSVLLVCSDPDTARRLITPMAQVLGPQMGPLVP